MRYARSWRRTAKGRFELRDDTDSSYVRATQGHTLAGDVIDDDAMMTRLTDSSGVDEAVHGTSMRAWESIRTHGLRRMRRRHVHMATGLPGDGEVKSGIRTDCEVAVWVDVRRVWRRVFLSS
jgi:RNA:NAD 2'-phosphotransferase (TPT1/KptA family)